MKKSVSFSSTIKGAEGGEKRVNPARLSLGDKEALKLPPTPRPLDGSSAPAVALDTQQREAGECSEDDEEGRAYCGDHEHFEIDCIDAIFQLSIEQIFELLFTDSQFYKDFNIVLKRSEAVMEAWPESPNQEGHRVRQLSIKLALNFTIGPKSAYSTETQTMYSASKPGKFYLIDAQWTNGDIPYGDSFYVINRYCVTRTSSTTCRLKITSSIRYIKSVWGVIKSLIDKNARKEIFENFRRLEHHIKVEADRQCQLKGGDAERKPGDKKKPHRRRRSQAASDQPERERGVGPVDGAEPPTLTTSAHLEEQPEPELVNVALMVVVCALLMFAIINVALLWKWWSLESQAQESPHYRTTSYNQGAGYDFGGTSVPGSLNKQRTLHAEELKRWKDVLTSCLHVVDQVTVTLNRLRDGVSVHAAQSVHPTLQPEGATDTL